MLGIEKLRRLLPFSIVFMALVLRFLRLDAAEPWLDEACTVHYATLPWEEFVASFTTESHPPFYYLTMRLWIALAGPSPVAIRLPSLIAGVAIVGLCITLGGRWFGTRAGIAAGLFAAVSPLSIHYSVEARQMAMASCLVLLALERLDAWASRHLPRDAVTYVVAATAALYTHYYVAFVIPWVPATFLASKRDGRGRGALLCFMPVVLFMPWMLSFVTGHLEGGSKAWLEDYWNGALDATWSTLAITGGATAFPRYLGALGAITVPEWIALAGPATSAILLMFGAFRALRTGPGVATLLWFLCPVVLPLAISIVVRPIYLPGRYEFAMMPAFAILSGAAVESGPVFLRWAGRAAFCSWLVLVIVVLSRYMPLELQQPHKAVHELLLRERHEVAQVSAIGFAWAPMAFWERLEPTGVVIHPVPSRILEHPGWWSFDTGPEPTDLAPVPLRHGDVWLVSLRGDGFRPWADAQSRRLIDAGYRPDRTIDIADVRLRVFKKRTN